VLSRAIIRDCVGRDRAGSLIGYVTMIMATGSAFSPLVAGLVDADFGWRANFAWLAVAAAGFAWATWRLLGETRDAAAAPAGARALLAGGWVLLRDPAYLGYALSTAFAMAVWYGFVAGAPFVLHAQLGLPTTAYGAWILLVLAGYVLGNFLAGRLSVRLGGARMIALGQAIALAGAAVQLGLLAAGVLTPLALFLPMAVLVFASGLFLPNLNAFAISVRPELAGSASGLTGFLQMIFSALATVAMGRWLEGSEAPLIALTAGGSLASAAALALARR
jgi:DHA1 family bicyclomycin/chloramphenicol resistance-like MFS transporter